MSNVSKTFVRTWLSQQHWMSPNLEAAQRTGSSWAPRATGHPSTSTRSGTPRGRPRSEGSRHGRISCTELIGSLKLGNVWVFVHLVFGPRWPINQLNKNPNNLRLPISSGHVQKRKRCLAWLWLNVVLNHEKKLKIKVSYVINLLWWITENGGSALKIGEYGGH